MGSCTSGSIGVRINPQLGEGGIATTGTVAPTSKFGVALEEARPQLLAAYGRYAWLSCVHVHVGSQGCPLGLLVQGASAVLQLAQEINAHVGSRQVRVLDLGGGLPVDYESDAPDADVPERLTMARYAEALREAVSRQQRRREPDPYYGRASPSFRPSPPGARGLRRNTLDAAHRVRSLCARQVRAAAEHLLTMDSY